MKMHDMDWPAQLKPVLDDSKEAQAQKLADAVAEQLELALSRKPRASIAVSGGTTPKEFFKALSQKLLPWARIDITLADERWVPAEHSDSNERLSRENLLQGYAAAANFFPLKPPGSAAPTNFYDCSLLLKSFSWPLDVLILGMGSDGHTASLFPDAAEIESALDPHHEGYCMVLHPPSQEQVRVSLTRRVLSQAGWTALQLRGEDKLTTLAAALEDLDDIKAMPIRAFLQTDIHVFWSP